MTYSVVLPDRTVKGPLSLAELEQLARQGLLTRETLVWSQDWPAWLPAGSVDELRPVLGAAPAPIAMPVAPSRDAPECVPPVRSMGQRNRLGRVLMAVTFFGAALAFLAWTQWDQVSELVKTTPNEASVSEARIVLNNQRLLVEAARFRSLASYQLDDALKAYGSPSCLAFLCTSEVGHEAPQVWAYFFSSSLLLIGHAQHALPIIAFYNPFLDAALLTRWSWNGDQATITDATLWVGVCFPDGKAVAPKCPNWLSKARKTPFHEALMASQREFVSRFDREFPIQAVDASHFPRSEKRAAAQTLVEQHAAAQLLALIELRTHRGLAALRQALAEGRSSALDALIPPGSSFDSAALLKLPRELRKRLVPSFALCSAQNTIVVLSVPELPRFYILAHFGTADVPLKHISVQELD